MSGADRKDLNEARRELEQALEALRVIAKDGGWRTIWNVDEAHPEAGRQPTIVNTAQEIARAALAGIR